MFELPDAKRVRREDLNDPVADAWSHGGDDKIDIDLQARLNAQIAESLGFLDTTPTTTREDARASPKTTSRLRKSRSLAQQRSLSNETPEREGQEEEGEENDKHDDDKPDAGEFEFRLFSSQLPAKVTLEEEYDDAATPREGRIVCPRPPSFYLAGRIPQTRKREYRIAAVSGEDVLLRSRCPAWGMAYPWKVVKGVGVARRVRRQDGCVMRVYGDADADAKADIIGDTKRRTRPGKKKRIATRQKLRMEKERQEAERKRAMDKEEQVKEKKKRLNRLKKLRKRAKNKEMKAGGKVDEEESDGDGEGSSGED
ncbi:hypothetical protein E4U55_000864 [Claviceps digitariae]|nr:hypothetical protein E4U55_000864 [Claviceps digitariae]